MDKREKETNWNCFITKFFLASKSQAPIFLNYMSTPLKKVKSLFCLIKKKLVKLEWFRKKINWLENINWFKIF